MPPDMPKPAGEIPAGCLGMGVVLMVADDGLSRRDRDTLAKLTRQRAQVAKYDAKQRAAQLVADGEAQLATIFKADDARWTDAVAVAETAVAEANAAINAHCEAAGVPEGFRPTIGTYWTGRRDNSTATRRAELRKVLATHVAALEKQAIAEIERRSLETQTALIAGGLDSDAARERLDSLPTAEALMPTLDIASFPEVAVLTGGRPWAP